MSDERQPGKLAQIVKLMAEAQQLTDRLEAVFPELCALGCVLTPPAWEATPNQDVRSALETGQIVEVSLLVPLCVSYDCDAQDEACQLVDGKIYSTERRRETMSQQMQDQVAHHLAKMMEANQALYARLSAEGGAFTLHFNAIVRLAGGTDDLQPTEPPGNGGR